MSSLVQLPVPALFPLLYTRRFVSVSIFFDLICSAPGTKAFLCRVLFKLKMFLHSLRCIFETFQSYGIVINGYYHTNISF